MAEREYGFNYAVNVFGEGVKLAGVMANIVYERVKPVTEEFINRELVFRGASRVKNLLGRRMGSPRRR